MKFCSACAAPLAESRDWPRRCPACSQLFFRNPLPVSVVLIPLRDGGVLTVRRTLPPAGQLALPGGFVNWGESWQEAAVREVREETGIHLQPESLSLQDAISVESGHLLLFSLAPAVSDWVPEFTCDEVSELVVVHTPTPLAFATHTEMLRRYLESR